MLVDKYISIKLDTQKFSISHFITFKKFLIITVFLSFLHWILFISFPFYEKCLFLLKKKYNTLHTVYYNEVIVNYI